MSVLITGVSLFTIALAVHIAVWRYRRPRSSGQVLIVLFVGVICVGAFLLGLGGMYGPPLALWLPGDLLSWIHALVVALALAAVYVMTYPAVEVESPTLIIIEAIAERGAAGLPLSTLQRRLDERILVAPRVQDLLDEKLAVLENGRYRPTAKGVALGRAFAAWRRVIRAGLGG
jgi:hypothetical protein